jgi:hypothetical protein
MNEKLHYNRFLTWLKKLKLNVFEFIIYLALLIFIGYKFVDFYYDKYYVKHNYQITIGKIIEYEEFGIGPNRYLTYSYIVNGSEIRREIDSPRVIFKECLEPGKKCDEKRFFVIYSRKHPERSLIDLTFEIQGIVNPNFPSSLLNFQ